MDREIGATPPGRLVAQIWRDRFLDHLADRVLQRVAQPYDRGCALKVAETLMSAIERSPGVVEFGRSARGVEGWWLWSEFGAHRLVDLVLGDDVS